MISIPLVLALVVAPAQVPNYEIVHQATGERRIAAVHVEAEVPEVRLGVYSETELLGAWPAGSPSNPISLAPNQSFTTDSYGNIVAIGTIEYECMDSPGGSGEGQATSISFPQAFGQILHPPWTPPQSQFAPPETVAGARFVHLGGQARLVAFTERALEDFQTVRTELYRRVQPTDLSFTNTGSFDSVGPGEFQSTLDGSLLAKAEGATVRLLNWQGAELTRVARDGPFELHGQGRWLATVAPQRVLFTRLGPDGAPDGHAFSLATQSPAGKVTFIAQHAVVLERKRVTVLRMEGQGNGVVLQKPPDQIGKRGVYTSASLVPLGPDSMALALGRHEVIRPPARIAGKFQAGLARAYVDLVRLPSLDLDDTLSTSFEVDYWAQDFPRVRFVGQPPRVLVVTSDYTALSNEVQ